jgi:hypothetical protein
LVPTKLNEFTVYVFNAIFNNISITSWQSFLLVEEIGMPGEKEQVTNKLMKLYCKSE